jgi:diaminopimelate epimerase
LTLACGSGATAVAAVAVRYWQAPANRELILHLPGGDLKMSVTPDCEVSMTGPAALVFKGDWSC